MDTSDILMPIVSAADITALQKRVIIQFCITLIARCDNYQTVCHKGHEWLGKSQCESDGRPVGTLRTDQWLCQGWYLLNQHHFHQPSLAASDDDTQQPSSSSAASRHESLPPLIMQHKTTYSRVILCPKCRTEFVTGCHNYPFLISHKADNKYMPKFAPKCLINTDSANENE